MERRHERERAAEILARLKQAYPDVRYYLNFSNPLELLVAAILSARCRDEVVNATTPQLFSKYKTAADYANADPAELEQAISSIPGYRTKARHIQEACRIIAEKHNGEVPQTMEELTALPGIGRKTANAILINAFDKITGIVVDTHVIRLAGRLGLSASKDPEKIERDLEELFPRESWKTLPWLLKAHGRAVCTARKPKCDKCVLEDLCPKVGVANA